MSYGHPEIISQLTQIIFELEKNIIQFQIYMYKYIYVEKKLTENNTDRTKSEETWDVVRTHKKQQHLQIHV